MTYTGLRAGCLALLLMSTPAAAQRSSRRVFRSADIAAAGWHRLGEAMAGLAPGNMSSIDGFNGLLTDNRLPFAGLSVAGSPRWMVRLDGQEIPVEIDGTWILDALPVTLTQIDSIVVASGPAIVDGTSALLGTMDIFTRRPKPKFSGVGDYEFGDESGDPGPYRYTPRTTPNVEKLGPSTSGAAAYAGSGWSLDAGVRYYSLNITDTSIARRFPGIIPALVSDVNASGGSGVLTTSFMNGTQYTIAGRGRFTGLLWVPSRRHEESVHLITGHAGSSGSFRLGSTPVRYGLSETRLETREVRLPLPICIGGTRVKNEAFGAVPVTGLSATIGAGFTAWSFSNVEATGDARPAFAATCSGSAVADSSKRTGRVWIDFHPVAADRGATISVQRTDNRVSPSATGWYATTLGPRYQVMISAGSIGRNGDDDGAWIDRLITGSPVPRADTRLNEVRVEVSDRSQTTFTPSVDLRLVNSPNWQLEAPLGSGTQPVDVLIFGAGVETKPLARVTASARAEASAVHATTTAMRDALKSTPAASLRADVSTVVMTNYRLSASGRFTTSTIWPVESVVGEAPELPALRRIDVSANKPFWHERIRAQLVIRNLFAADERYHPVGASWNFRTHLAVTIALPPYSSSSTKP